MTKNEKIKKLSYQPQKLEYRQFISDTAEESGDSIIEKANADGRLKAVLNSPDRGALGESLKSEGLLYGGFSDYLKKSLADDINADFAKAQNNAAVKDFASNQSYRKYVDSYNTAQEKIRESVLEKLVSGGILDKSYAYRLAKEAGLSDENALYTASAGVNRAKKKSIIDVIKYAEKNNLYPANAKLYALNVGLDDRSAEMIYDALSTNGYSKTVDLEGTGGDRYYEMLKASLRNKERN